MQLLLEADHLGGKAGNELRVGRSEWEVAARRLERGEALGAIVGDHLFEHVEHAPRNVGVERPKRIKLAQRLLIDAQLPVLAT